jgi:hypothetical protein
MEMNAQIITLSFPLIGIVAFLLSPFPLAMLIHLLKLLVSGMSCWIRARATKKRPAYAMEPLTSSEARLVSRLGSHTDARFLVGVRGELERQFLRRLEAS